MTDYRAPVRDMMFVLENIAELPALAALEPFEHAETDLVAQVLEEAARLAGEVIGPLNATGDQQGSVLANGVVTTPDGFADAYRQFREGGWNGVPFDPEMGGGGLPWAVAVAVQEMWAGSNMAFSLCPLLTQGATELLLAHASPEQKETYVRKMVEGVWTGTMNLTEPQAGTDVGAVKTKAEPAGDGSWRITGSKIFITYGEHDMAENIVHLVLARTPGAPPGTKGISCFIVPKYLVNPDGSLGGRNDVRCVSIEHKLGIHASPTCVLSFGDEGGAIGYLIGEENSGMRYMFTMMNNARLAVGLQGVAIAERSYQQALEYARERRQGRAPGTPAGESSPIIEFPDVRRMLMTMRAGVEASRALVYLNASAIDFSHNHPDEEVRRAKGALAELLTPISKAWSTDLGCELTSIGVQIHGGMGFIEETGAAQHMRDARIAPIYEGTNGVQALDLVGRKLPMMGGEPVRALIGEMANFTETLGTAGADFAAIAEALGAGVRVLTETTQWLFDNMADDPRTAAAGSAPYLRMFGGVLGAYLLAKQALAAADQGGDFAAAKLTTAQFFADNLLPPAVALKRAVTAGPEPLYAIPDAMLGT